MSQNQVKTPEEIFRLFDCKENPESIKPLGNGLINDTYLVKTGGERDYVLQKVNTAIFQDTAVLETNIGYVCEALSKALPEDCREPERHCLRFLPSRGEGKMTVSDGNGGEWRVSVFIPRSRTLEEVTPFTAELAGREFGRFEAVCTPQAMYAGDKLLEKFRESIPDFHNMELRIRQLDEAVKADPVGRLCEVKELVEKIGKRAKEMCSLEEEFRAGVLPKRICHCDTKVNNMLFDKDSNEVLCVIDLDTAMPSFVTSDFGDFLRTGAATVAEDSPELDKVDFRMEIFEAFTKGYISGTSGFLTEAELKALPFGAALFPYMQCVRFLADYINGDKYYKTTYETHNLVRTRNQWRLFEITDSLRPQMERIVESLAKEASQKL